MTKFIVVTALLYLTSWTSGQSPYTCWNEQVDQEIVALTCFGIDDSNVVELVSELDYLASIDGVQINLQLERSVIADLPSDLLRGYPIRSLALMHDDLAEFPQALLENVDSALVVLNLAFNAIPEVRASHFKNLPFLETLQILVLSDNELTNLTDVNVFRPFTHLQKLFLHLNEIEDLPENAFDGLLDLEELKLYGNQIKTVAKSSFGYLPSLARLYLSLNHIRVLENETWSDEKQPALVKLYLGNNPFLCDCYLSWLNTWMLARNLMFDSDATCETPDLMPFEFAIFCPVEGQDTTFDTGKLFQFLAAAEEVIMQDPRERAYRLAKRKEYSKNTAVGF